MTAIGFDPEVWTLAVIVAAVLIGLVRLCLWQRSAPVSDRASRWRLGLLLGLQPLAGLLLWLTLFPPAGGFRTETLVVLTGGGPQVLEKTAGEIVVALPEADAGPGVTRVPDLATALRRVPAAARLRVVGPGLVPRDQGPVGLPVAFDPPAQADGFIDLAFPDTASPGARFSVGGQIGSLAAGTVELVDPAGSVIARQRVAAGQRFVVTANARAPGLVLFSIRLRDAAGGLIEQVAIPVETLAWKAPSVLVLSGAPGAETKYLTRWAQDSDIDLAVDIDIGGGIQLGDPRVPLTRARLTGIDLAVIDERRWEALGAAERGALVAAVDEGLGLLLRPTGPLPAATRRDWAALGVSLNGSGDGVVPLQLDLPSTAPDVQTGTGQAADADALPELSRRNLVHESAGAVSMLRDAEGAALASWRPRGRGRVGIWIVADSYALVLAGHADRYGEMWSELFSVLARFGEDGRVEIDGLARVGSRVALCRLAGDATVTGQDGGDRSLRIDPVSGEHACAAWWPERSGWHLVRDGQGRETPVYVHPADAAPSQFQAANRAATLALTAAGSTDKASRRLSQRPGSPWPWFAALLVVLSALWWFERNRRGFGASRGQAGP